MKLEEQVCTHEQSKRLQELGIKVAPNFYWVNVNELWASPGVPLTWVNEGLAYPAYTVAELTPPYGYSVMPDKVNGAPIFTIWGIGDNNKLTPVTSLYEHYTNEAAARADLLIHLIETGTITPTPAAP